MNWYPCCCGGDGTVECVCDHCVDNRCAANGIRVTIPAMPRQSPCSGADSTAVTFEMVPWVNAGGMGYCVTNNGASVVDNNGNFSIARFEGIPPVDTCRTATYYNIVDPDGVQLQCGSGTCTLRVKFIVIYPANGSDSETYEWEGDVDTSGNPNGYLDCTDFSILLDNVTALTHGHDPTGTQCLIESIA